MRDVYLHVNIRYTGAKIAAQIRGSRHAVTCVFLCGAGACCWLWLWLPIEQRGSEPMLSQSGRNEATPLAFDAFLVVATAHTGTQFCASVPACGAGACCTYVLRACACVLARLSLSCFYSLGPWEGGALRCVALRCPTPPWLFLCTHPSSIMHVAVAVLVDG